MSVNVPEKPPEADSNARVVRWARNLAAVGLALFLLVGLGTNLRAGLLHELDFFPEPVTWSSFLQGRTTANIASTLAAAPIPAHSARLQRGLAWELIGDLGPRVRIGCPGWLFITDELDVHPQGLQDMATRAAVLARMRDVLQARGIDLMVVTVPDKSRIEDGQLCGLARPAALATRLDDWQAMLRTHGIASVDLQQVLRTAQHGGETPVFLRTDTHWNEAGAEAAAQATADAVLARNVRPVPEQRWQVQKQPERIADLIRLAGLDQWRAHRSLQADEVQASRFVPAEAGAQAMSAADLFGDVQTPNVALIGTSFSNNSNFGGFLEMFLQARIGRFAKDGGDFDGAARDYFSGDTFRQNPPELLIWEIPERVLSLPDAHEAEMLLELLPRSS